MMHINYVDLGAQHRPIMDALLSRVKAMLSSGMFILGEEVRTFEKRFADYCGVQHAIGVGNGTDALILALKAHGIGTGDEVITVSHTFLASASSIVLSGAVPRFVDIGADMNMNPALLEDAITPKTKAVIAVHLCGRPAEMDAIGEVCRSHDLVLIEDAAQAVGAVYKGQKTGSIGDIACFSLHPLKNLSAAGDAGVITTNNDNIFEWLTKARNHGLEDRDHCAFWSSNTRLDALQAAILNVKFDHLEEWTQRRIAIARRYNDAFRDHVTVPDWPEYMQPVFHAYVIRHPERDALQHFLSEKGIDTKVHYPLAVHQQKAADQLPAHDLPVTEQTVKEILSIPVYPELSDKAVDYICEILPSYFTS